MSNATDAADNRRAPDDLYKRLGIGKGSSENEIKRAYRMLALKKHPDKGGDPEEFKLIAEAYAILSDPEKRRVYDATGEMDMTDLDIEEFLSSGMLDSFFREMMEETGLADEMLAMGDGITMDDLHASFESFFKASMGFGDGPVIMPDGTTIDAGSVPTMAEMAALDMGGDAMEADEMAMLMRLTGGSGGFGGLPLPKGLRGGKKGKVTLDDLDDDDEEVDAMLAAMMARQMGTGGRGGGGGAALGGGRRAERRSAPPAAAAASSLASAPVDRRLPLEQQWVHAAKAGATGELRRCYEADATLLQKPARGIGHTALHWSAAAGHLENVQWLLDVGCPVDVRNAGESTPLHSAAGAGHLVVVEELLRRGADPSAADSGGETPQQIAEARGHADVAAALRSASK